MRRTTTTKISILLLLGFALLSSGFTRIVPFRPSLSNMVMTSENPGGSFDSKMSRISRFMDEFAENFFLTPANTVAPSLWKPSSAIATIRVDVGETDKEYTIKAELPGIKKEDIHLSFDNGNLVISAERKEEHEEKRGKDEKGNVAGTTYYYKEISHGKVYRAFKLPPNADVSASEASFQNGVLTITLRKISGTGSAKKLEIK